MIPQPKFNVGDTVFVAGTERRQFSEKCPDCLGTLKWRVICPGGEEFDAPCETCRYGYERRGSVFRWEPVATVKAMIVGSVRIDTNDENPIEYMMIETGVGSGTLWREQCCFATREEAQSAADVLVQERYGEEAVEAKKRRQLAREGNLPSPRREIERELQDLRFQLQKIEERKRRSARKAKT